MATGRSGCPSAFACVRASTWKAVVAMVSVARRRFCNSTASWTLHDVHEPQSPDPVMIRSHWSTSSCMTAAVAGTEAMGLRRVITSFTP